MSAGKKKKMKSVALSLRSPEIMEFQPLQSDLTVSTFFLLHCSVTNSIEDPHILFVMIVSNFYSTVRTEVAL